MKEPAWLKKAIKEARAEGRIIGESVAPHASLTLTLPYPPTLNSYYRHVGHKVLISADGRSYRQAVQDAVGKVSPIPGQLAVLIDCFPPDLRRRDLDNVNKALLDSLTHARVYGDDSQIVDLHLRWAAVERPAGKVVITIRCLPTEETTCHS